MSKQELLEAQEQEHQLAYQDNIMERTKDRKNALESYVYDTRNKVDLQPFAFFCNYFCGL
jgi:heat shock 70kDa protein 4